MALDGDYSGMKDLVFLSNDSQNDDGQDRVAEEQSSCPAPKSNSLRNQRLLGREVSTEKDYGNLLLPISNSLVAGRHFLQQPIPRILVTGCNVLSGHM
jgi:hypothetical protein